ncbi:uracil-DNA glycosylase family protein [Acidovorax sp. M2(2025)]|uniref:uracil-DNA glycosylase family protein n=1 Tax=Acidovorax sp. M2(2025) TaxID=3411355 RepID=UPI003BF53B4D
MSLHLDPRQRAMLQEMGITVWASAAVEPAPEARLPQNAAAAVAAVAAPAPIAAPAARPAPPHATPSATTPEDVPRAAASAHPAAAPGAAPALRLHAPQALYPAADPQAVPPELGSGWLIVAESPAPAEPLGGDVGRLLDNMLRAMQLHRHPRVFFAALERAAVGTDAGAAEPPAAALADAVASLRPAMVLVLGHVAARAVLGRSEPLGRLRASPHQLAGCPAVVTYDPAFLMRSQDTKAAAWADLCQALATVRAGAAVP